jgi:hypothetical protein
MDRDLKRRPKPIVWHKTPDQILDSLKKYLAKV